MRIERPIVRGGAGWGEEEAGMAVRMDHGSLGKLRQSPKWRQAGGGGWGGGRGKQVCPGRTWFDP